MMAAELVALSHPSEVYTLGHSSPLSGVFCPATIKILGGNKDAVSFLKNFYRYARLFGPVRMIPILITIGTLAVRLRHVFQNLQ